MHNFIFQKFMMINIKKELKIFKKNTNPKHINIILMKKIFFVKVACKWEQIHY